MLSRNKCRIVGNRSALFLSRRAAWGIPRGLFIYGVVMLVAAVVMVILHDIDAANRDSVLAIFSERAEERISGVWSESLRDRYAELFATRFSGVPNAKHVWWAYELFVDDKGKVMGFAKDYKDLAGNWSALCVMDSNDDGLSNGRHLGDPCCRWQPSQDEFALHAEREYRRWHLSHPSEQRSIARANMNDTLALDDEPTECSLSYDSTTYKEQFLTFYFHKADAAPEELTYSVLKLAAFITMVAILAHWAMRKNLLTDALPWTTSQQALPGRVRLAVFVVSFFYMDLTSGVIHLVLDYAPFHLPGIGILARGFQFHHHDPTAIIRISWFEYVSHIHLLCPLIQCAIVLGDASRVQRLFWFWGGVWAHLFQTAHRWAHMPPEWLPWIVRTMQATGLLLSHDRHMSHHEDLERQFTILSGHTDVILDNLCSIVPPARYDLWFSFGVVWFLLPIFVDAISPGAVPKPHGADAECRLDKVGRQV